MDNKDIKILKLIFNEATSDGERLNAINFIIKKYGKETVDQILNNKSTYNFENDYYKHILLLWEEKNQLNKDLSHAKFCTIFWFTTTIIMIILSLI